MKVLVNATTLVKGGGIQVAASFIAESCKDALGIEWHYAISPQIAAELGSLGVAPQNAHIYESSPTRNKEARVRLLQLEAGLAPDVVFSVFGPAYMRFRAPHLLGVAVGWVTHSTRLAFSTLPGAMARLKTVLTCIYKGVWLRFADRWVVEAESAREGMARRIGIPAERVDIVPNTCARIFRETQIAPALRPGDGQTLRLLYVSAYYPHKNIELIPEVAAELQRLAPEQRVEFVVTLPQHEPGWVRLQERARSLGVSGCIRNVGKVTLSEIIELYREAHICFMPSLLETFSATYPEAMAMGRPIVTSDLDFAHNTCGDAAEYFSANDPRAAAQSILELAGSQVRWDECIAKGSEVLGRLPDARGKYELYVEAIRATAAEM